jgi:dipeptidyl aminopeptidase/acylaminoacyl peptidase
MELDRRTSICTRAVGAVGMLVALVVGMAPISASAQQAKTALDHEDVLRWTRIEDRAISPDGQWVAYALTRLEGEPTLVIVATDGSGRELRLRGTDPVFTGDSRFVAFQIPPMESVLDSLKLEGEKEDDLPGDSVAVVTLADAFATGAAEDAGVFRAGPVKSFSVPEKGGAWLAYLMKEEPEEEESEEPAGEKVESEPAEPEPAAEPGEPEAQEEEGDEEEDREKEDGTSLRLRDLTTGAEHEFEHAISYVWAESGSAFAYAASTEDGSADGAFVVEPTSGRRVEVAVGEGHYKGLALDEAGARFAFLTDRDDWEADEPAYALYAAESGDWSAHRVANQDTESLPSGWWVSEHQDPSFSDDGSRLFFGTAPRPEPEPDEEVLEEDQVKLDVWNWKDPYLQPMQLVQADDEKKRTYLAVAHEGDDRVVQLASLDIPDVRQTEDGGGDFVLGSTDGPYRQEISWDGRYQDAYAIDVRTGTRRRVAARIPFAMYNELDDHPQEPGETVNLTARIPFAMYNELDDHPQEPGSYGNPQWTEGDRALLVYDRHDVWRTDPAGRDEPINITAGHGRQSDLRYRVVRVDPDEPAVPNGDILVSSFHLENKRAGFARGRSDRSQEPAVLLAADARFGAPQKASQADVLVWTRESFTEFPDLWASGPGFGDSRKLSDANPQQAEYLWGTAELVSWVSNDGIPLQGALYKPEDFDPTRKYPMMVYFYERMSDRLHQYRTPRPGSSSVAFSFYVSRGYVLFVPDIPYEIGYPGESALDAVVPGVLSLIDEGFVDPDRIGVQGHSWGGYQIAYMITKTNLFAAAEAGAPVSNMTSAYGGIRWQSGMSRMFQYERSQSRIGGTLWESTMEYLHNSPVFYADKIHTPLLMLHNDEDGAVPWYQGIEMFVAMRRLGKPVFLLNYNGEAHGLRRDPNQRDWAIRMQQFFDHYLLDAPPPVWMERGVPAVVKGRDMGFELVTEAAVSEEEGEQAGRGGGSR